MIHLALWIASALFLLAIFGGLLSLIVGAFTPAAPMFSEHDRAEMARLQAKERARHEAERQKDAAAVRAAEYAAERAAAKADAARKAAADKLAAEIEADNIALFGEAEWAKRKAKASR